MDQFWSIVDLLEQDIEPTDAQWDSLFNTPGCLYLVEKEGKDTLFMQYFPLVFIPSKRAELQTAQEAGADRYLSHYLR